MPEIIFQVQQVTLSMTDLKRYKKNRNLFKQVAINTRRYKRAIHEGKLFRQYRDTSSKRNSNKRKWK
jgi:hypothetical protein